MIDNVGFGTIFFGYSNVFSILSRIILYNFYLVLLVLMQCSYRLCSLSSISRPLDSHFFVGSYMVNHLLSLFDFSVNTVNNLSDVLAETIITFDVFFLKILCDLCSLRKYLSTKFKNLLPTLVVTLLLNGGLNQTVFRFLCNFLVLFLILSTFGSIYSSDSWYSNFFNTSSYSGFTELEICLLEEFLESILLINVGNLFKSLGGWFDDL